jgi:PAS domain S-box-containing protein
MSEQERASAEERLLEREEQYRRIFEATSDGLIVNDLDTGLVVEVNPAFCRMHGYEYDELIGIHPSTFIHPDDHHLFAEYIEAVSEGREFRARAREIRKDGSIFHVEVHGTTFLFRGLAARARGVARCHRRGRGDQAARATCRRAHAGAHQLAVVR